MRIALIANPASGGGQDPEPLAAAIRRHGAEVGTWGLAVEQLEACALHTHNVTQPEKTPPSVTKRVHTPTLPHPAAGRPAPSRPTWTASCATTACSASPSSTTPSRLSWARVSP